jgi:hypothetical protein
VKSEAKTEGADTKTEQPSSNGNKRSREDDNGSSETPAAKKVDTKSEVAAEAS